MSDPGAPSTPALATVSPAGLVSARTLIWALHMALPLAGLWLLLARPELDFVWEDHPAHFWLVLGVALVNVALSGLINRAAEQRSDARLYLVSLAFLSAAGFLALHALATPRVLLGPNGGFATASPVGLFLASVFAAASALELRGSRASTIIQRRNLLRGLLIAFMAAWATVSLLNLPPLDRPMPAEQATGVLAGLALGALVLYGAAALGYYRLYRRRPAVMLVGLITAFVLLAEAMVATVVGRNWHASWWEWHVLMALGFGFVAYSAHVQYEREGSVTSLFRSISLEQTIREIREEYAAALESLVAAIQRRAEAGNVEPLPRLTARLAGGFGLTEGQADVLERAAEALAGERDQIRRLRTLVAIGQEARVIVDEDDLLDRALAQIRAAFGRDVVRIGLLREGRLVYPPLSTAGETSPSAHNDPAGDPVGPATGGAAWGSAAGGANDFRHAAGDSAARAAEDSAADVPGNAAIAEALRELRPTVGDRHGDGSMIALPLTVKSRAAGVLTVERARGEFAERDRSVLDSLASQLSVALENARLYRQIDRLFRQYLSPDVATALLADPEQAALGGAVVEVTVLFADLRGFTPFSERSSPEQVVTMLNRYFGAVVPIVIAEGGTIAQFIGDAIMALFNAPARQPDHALRAARAALAMQSAVDDIAAGQPDWPRFRIGINTGPALIGNIGSEEMRNFTAIGDTTNLAARLQTSAAAGEVVIGAGTYTLIRDVALVRPLAPLQVKGKHEPVQAYVLTGLRGPGGRPTATVRR
jgi:class 3 adenylate cyclase